MAPDLWQGDKVQHADGNVSHWHSPSGGENKPAVEHIVVWDRDSGVAKTLFPLNGKKVSETKLTAITGTTDGTVNHVEAIREELDAEAVLEIDARVKRK